jgi:hypothetical protein
MIVEFLILLAGPLSLLADMLVLVNAGNNIRRHNIIAGSVQ